MRGRKMNIFRKKKVEYYDLDLLHNPHGVNLRFDDINYLKVYK